MLKSLNSAPQKVAEVRHGETLTVQDFLEQYPIHILVQKLDRGAFGRGLPRKFSGLTGVAAFFRTLLRDSKFEREDTQQEDHDGAVHICHRRGWIHATAIPRRVRYTFPSPLHRACLSWMIEPTDDMPHFTSLFELFLETITKFKPSQLQLALHPVASESTHPPEATIRRRIFIIRCYLSLPGMFVSRPSMRLPRERVRPTRVVDGFIKGIDWQRPSGPGHICALIINLLFWGDATQSSDGESTHLLRPSRPAR